MKVWIGWMHIYYGDNIGILGYHINPNIDVLFSFTLVLGLCRMAHVGFLLMVDHGVGWHFPSSISPFLGYPWPSQASRAEFLAVVYIGDSNFRTF